MSEPAVTVLMTVFNAGRFLDSSIRSILAQTFRRFRVSHRRRLLYRRISGIGGDLAESKDSRIRVIRNSHNRGQTACLNQGLELARGQWIARHDADDLSHPTRPSVAASAHDGQAGYRVRWAPMVGSSMSGTARRSARRPDSHNKESSGLRLSLIPSCILRSSSAPSIIRDEFGGYDPGYRIAQDYELWTRVISRYQSANLPQRLICLSASRDIDVQGLDENRPSPKPRTISDREVGANFGRELDMTARAHLIAQFREGLDPSKRKPFWRAL